MTLIKHAGVLFLIAGILSAQQAIEDPVMNARALRASTPSHEDDLPPVPRAILEPPPLPPPVTHVKDTPGYRASRKAKKSKRKTAKTSKGTKASTPVKKKPAAKKP
jgi:hypothetical protein